MASSKIQIHLRHETSSKTASKERRRPSRSTTRPIATEPRTKSPIMKLASRLAQRAMPMQRATPCRKRGRFRQRNRMCVNRAREAASISNVNIRGLIRFSSGQTAARLINMVNTASALLRQSWKAVTASRTITARQVKALRVPRPSAPHH